jgi:hypothetical protein
MEGVYATLALVGAVTGYGFTKAKKQSFQKYVMSSQEIESATQAGQEIDTLTQTSSNKRSAYDYVLRKLPEFVRTKATKTLASFNQSKESGAPPSVAYSNLRLALLSDRELGNITANQELYFPKRDVFYKWFREGLAAPVLPSPVTPESARSASQFSARTEGWGGEETPVPQSLMTLEAKREILQRLGITNRPTFTAWAETRRQTQPERVREIEGYVNEVFPVQAPPRITIPDTPMSARVSAPAVTVPPPAPAPARPTAAESSALAATITVPPPAPAVTVPPPAPAPAPEPEPAAGTGLGIAETPEIPVIEEVATPLPVTLPPPAPAPLEFTQINPMFAPAPTVAVPPPAPAPAPAVTQRQRPSLLSRLRRVTLRAPRITSSTKKDAAKLTELGITDVDSFVNYLQGKSSVEQMDTLRMVTSVFPQDADVFFDAAIDNPDVSEAFQRASSKVRDPITKVVKKARKARPSALVTAPAAISALTSAPPTVEEAPVELDQINPMFAPAPTVTVPAPAPAPSDVVPPHLRGISSIRPSPFAPAPSVTVPPPAPAPTVTVPPPPREGGPAAGTGLGLITAPETPLPAVSQPATPLPVTQGPPPNTQELQDYLREQTPPIVDMNSFLAWTKANEALGPDEATRMYKIAIAAFPAATPPTTQAPRTELAPALPPATPQQIEELRGFLAMQTPPITDEASLAQWMQENASKTVQEQENIFLIYERAFQTRVSRDLAPPPAPTAEVPPPAPAPAPAYQLVRQPGTRRMVPIQAKTRAATRKATQITNLKQWLLTADVNDTTKAILKAYIEQHPSDFASIYASLKNTIKGKQFLQEYPDITADLVALRQLQQLETQGTIPQQVTPEEQALLSQIQTPQDELEAVLSAPTPTVTVALPAPLTPPPAPAPVPPNALNSTQAKEWLATNLGVQNQNDFRRWIRENTSIVTEPILVTAEVAFPMGTLSGSTNFRTVYEALKSGKQARATTQRRGGRKARKNTLRRRPKVNTKNVRRTSHRKNRAKRTD